MDRANTQGHADVGTTEGRETVADVAAKCSAIMVGRRTTQNVGAALNGDPVAPSTARARRVRSEAQREGGYVGWEGVLACDFADLADGVPVELVVAAHEYAIAAIRARAPKFRIDRPLGALNIAETKAQARLDLAQFRLAEQPECPLALAEALAARDHYATVFGEFTATLRHRLTVSRSATPARQFVGRRRTLALHA